MVAVKNKKWGGEKDRYKQIHAIGKVTVKSTIPAAVLEASLY